MTVRTFLRFEGGPVSDAPVQCPFEWPPEHALLVLGSADNEVAAVMKFGDTELASALDTDESITSIGLYHQISRSELTEEDVLGTNRARGATYALAREIRGNANAKVLSGHSAA